MIFGMTAGTLTRSALPDPLDATVRVFGETALVPRVYRPVARPGPAPELRLPVVGNRLLDLRGRVHDEGTVLRDLFLDGPALEQEELRLSRAVLEDELDVWNHERGNVGRELFATDHDGRPAEEINHAIRAWLGRRKRGASVRFQRDGPDGDVTVRASGP